MFIIDELFCKHVYRRFKEVDWRDPVYRDGYRYKWLCRDCMKLRLSKGPMLDLRKRK